MLRQCSSSSGRPEKKRILAERTRKIGEEAASFAYISGKKHSSLDSARPTKVYAEMQFLMATPRNVFSADAAFDRRGNSSAKLPFRKSKVLSQENRGSLPFEF